MLALRNAIADGMTAESASLAQRLIDGALSLVEWAKAFAKLIRAGVGAGFLLGRGGRATADAAAKAALADLVNTQLAYAKAFAADVGLRLGDGTATVEGVAARSALYAGASVQAFDQGRSLDWGVRLPFYPSDGDTACGGNCRCAWEIADFEDRIEATWHTEGDSRVCDDCRSRGNRYGPGSPFVQSKVSA
ncbi:MAG: hypothetical protein IT337_09315 [Thermomicrobiales bacterium]|nr:hypothetical protein [Thermomicrobiales bacterium]